MLLQAGQFCSYKTVFMNKLNCLLFSLKKGSSDKKRKKDNKKITFFKQKRKIRLLGEEAMVMTKS